MNSRIGLIAAALLMGCAPDEGFITPDINGRVVLPAAAAEYTKADTSGTEATYSDVRFIGPVYLGLYSATYRGPDGHDLPTPGPVGAAYPYGGMTIGDYRYACLEALSCRVISGRYESFQSLVDWFNDEMEVPVYFDGSGDVVETGEYIRQNCYQLLRYTEDEEIQILPKDKNEDGQIDLNDLDFVQNSDGDWEADFTIWQQQFVEGFRLWGWMDAPAEAGYVFEEDLQSEFRYSSCNPNQGYNQFIYDRDYFAGTQYVDLLNVPSNYITNGDWVAEESIAWNDPEEEVVLRLGVQHGATGGTP